MVDTTTVFSFDDDDCIHDSWWQLLVVIIGLLSMFVIIIAIACVLTRGCKEDSNPKQYYSGPQSVFSVGNRPSSPSVLSVHLS